MTLLYAIGQIHKGGFRVSMITPACMQITMADFLVTLLFGKGSECSNKNAIMHHAPDSVFTAKDCHVLVSEWGSEDVLLEYGYVAPTALVRLIDELAR